MSQNTIIEIQEDDDDDGEGDDDDDSSIHDESLDKDGEYILVESEDEGDESSSEQDSPPIMADQLKIASQFEEYLNGPYGGKRKQRTIQGWVRSVQEYLLSECTNESELQGIACSTVHKYVECLQTTSAKVRFAEAFKELVQMTIVNAGQKDDLPRLQISEAKSRLLLKTLRKMKREAAKNSVKTVEELEKKGEWMDFQDLKRMTCDNQEIDPH